jgi:hypothetical protein
MKIENSTTSAANPGAGEHNKLTVSALASAKREKRGGYHKLEPGAYREPLLKTLEEAFHAVMIGELSLTKMVRFNSRAQHYELRFGIGKRCVRLETTDTSADEDLVFYNTADLLAALQELHKRTKQGEYDQALNAKLQERQEHAYAMLSKRKSDGFMSRKTKIRKLTEGIAEHVVSPGNEGWNDLKDLDNSAPINTGANSKQSEAAE